MFGVEQHERGGVSVNDLFADPGRDPRSVILTTDFGVDVIASSPGLKNTGMNMQPTQLFMLRDILAGLAGDYDLIIIDTPPGAGYMTLNARAAASHVLVPVAASGFSEEGLAATIASMQEARSINPGLQLAGILFTLVEKRTIVSASTTAGIRKQYANSKLFFPDEIPKASFLNQGNAVGIPGVLLKPRHPAAKAYKKVARRLLHD